jgi:small subunit ribosomal protein S6
MADHAPTYDLLVLLSSDVPDERRTSILSAVESAISSGGGSVERNDDWGRRPMAYEIRHQPEAEYHLLQFQAPPSVIEELSHTLRITDGVLRHRIIKVKRGTPPVKPGAPPVVSAVASGTGSDGARSAARPPREQPDEEAPAPAAVAAPATSEPSAEAPGPAGDGDLVEAE